MSQDSTAPNSFIAPSIEELSPLFPAYEIEAFIAEGGMGAVYKASQKSLDRPVAIKILPREFGADEQFRESFEAEAKAMARLNHPNLIGVYDFGAVDGMLFIIMEYVQGKALYYSIHKKAIEPATATGLIHKISRGIAHAHAGGILHRDIKPANILLDIDASPKIGDFGLARPLDNDRGESMTFGTPGYTAPEVYNRQYPIDQRSDIFSIGAMLYELVTGRAPEEGASNMISGLDPRLDTIITKATHADPNQRYSDINTFADEIENLASLLSGPRLTAGPLASPSTPPSPAVTPLASAKKSSAIPLITMLCVLVIGGLAALMVLKGDKPSQTPKKEEIAKIDPTPEPEPKPDKIKHKPKPKQKPKQKSNPEPIAIKKAPKQKPAPKPEPTLPEPKPKNNPDGKSLEELKSLLASGSRDALPKRAIQRGDSAYLLYQSRTTWREAYTIAQEYGASLASVKSADDLAWIQENFTSKTIIWLGATDSPNEGHWKWLDQSDFDTSLWLQGSPDNDGEEDFAGLSPNGLEDYNGEASCTALFEWKMDGSNPGSDAAQIARTAADLAAKIPPTFPVFAYEFEGSRYMLIRNSINFHEAYKESQPTGGHLAVLSSQAEADFLSNLMKSSLAVDESCWFGAYRNEKDPERWNTMTGEVMTFHNWFQNQPDNKDQKEFALQYMRKNWGNNHGFNDQDPGIVSEYYLLEWSHPSKRNYPGKPQAQSNEFKIIEEIREKLRDKHERSYQRFRKKNDKLVSDWVKDATRWVEREKDLDEGFAETLITELKNADAAHKLPDKLPQFAPKTLKRSYNETNTEIYEVWTDYEEDFDDAQSDYLEALRKEGLKARSQGHDDLVLLINRELTATSSERIHIILDGQYSIPVPEAN
ncbi:MAG: protein kinase domain-containing protein [Akkermansiaceae bacterium]